MGVQWRRSWGDGPIEGADVEIDVEIRFELSEPWSPHLVIPLAKLEIDEATVTVLTRGMGRITLAEERSGAVIRPWSLHYSGRFDSSVTLHAKATLLAFGPTPCSLDCALRGQVLSVAARSE